MDIIAHGLWAGAAVRLYNKKNKDKILDHKKPKISVWKTSFWAIFPDLVTFIPFVIWFVPQYVFGTLTKSALPRYIYAEEGVKEPFIYELTHALYTVTHSAVIFFCVVGLVWLWFIYCKKRRGTAINYVVFAQMAGWLSHIIIDIPTHTYAINATPVLWPISTWRFDGVSWEHPWFLALNYFAILITYAYIFQHKFRKKPEIVPVIEETEATI